MIVGVTGTRGEVTKRQSLILVDILSMLYDIEELHHGDCLGADAQVHYLAVSRDIKVVIHPPTNARWRAFCGKDDPKVTILPEADYLVRNKHIVKAAQLMIVIPRTNLPEWRSGTWSTHRYAEQQGVPSIIVNP